MSNDGNLRGIKLCEGRRETLVNPESETGISVVITFAQIFYKNNVLVSGTSTLGNSQ